ncbi:hypothetical protein Tsubulata_040121, partial [Turnera subulata]
MSSPPPAGAGLLQPALSPSVPLSRLSPSSPPSSIPPSSLSSPTGTTMATSTQTATPTSIRDKLVAATSNSSTMEDDFEEQPDDITAFHTPEGPVVKLSERYRSMLHKRWANTLIVKLWGRRIGFKALCNKLPNLWKLRENVRVVDLANNFYFLRFSNREDYMHALTDGPWIVFDHCLTVEPWIPQFDPANHKIKSVVAWVQIPKLSCEYYDRRLLHTVCNMIGRLVRIDQNMQEAIRGRYARVTLETNLEKPLQSQVFVDSKWFHISYENVPQICFSCGHAGHVLANCPLQNSTNTNDNDQTGESVLASTVNFMDGGPRHASPSGVVTGGLAHQPRGEWMVAAPHQRRPPRAAQPQTRKETLTVKETPQFKSGIAGQSSGSRFDILTDYVPVARPTPTIKETGQNPRVPRKNKRPLPYECTQNPLSSISPVSSPSFSFVLPNQNPPKGQYFTNLLEKISFKPSKSNSMDTSFDTNGLGHKDIMDKEMPMSTDDFHLYMGAWRCTEKA